MNVPIDRIATNSLIKDLKGFFLGAYNLDIVILVRFNENIWKQPYHNDNEIQKYLVKTKEHISFNLVWLGH